MNYVGYSVWKARGYHTFLGCKTVGASNLDSQMTTSRHSEKTSKEEMTSEETFQPFPNKATSQQFNHPFTDSSMYFFFQRTMCV